MARRGPKGERFDDAPYLYRMAELIKEKNISAWQAAQRVVDAALPGASHYAKTKRLYAKYQRAFGRYERIYGARHAMMFLTLGDLRRHMRSTVKLWGRLAQECFSPEVAQAMQILLHDEELMQRFGHLTPGQFLERWKILQPPLRKRNYLQKGR